MKTSELESIIMLEKLPNKLSLSKLNTYYIGRITLKSRADIKYFLEHTGRLCQEYNIPLYYKVVNGHIKSDNVSIEFFKKDKKDDVDKVIVGFSILRYYQLAHYHKGVEDED